MASGSLNRVLLIGRLGSDPEVRYTSNGGAVANFSLATNENWTDKSGQKQERTEWHRVVVWGKLGELCGQYLSKGRQAFVEGRLQTRDWTDKEGNKKYTTEVVATNIQFLGAGSGAGDRAPGMSTGPSSEFAPGPSDFEPSMGSFGASSGGMASQSPTGGTNDDEVPF